MSNGKFCTQCGFQNTTDAIFCANCGNKLNQVQAEPAMSVPENSSQDPTPATSVPTMAVPPPLPSQPPNSNAGGQEAVPVPGQFTPVMQVNYPKAGLGSRLLAYIVDSFIGCLPMVPGFFFMMSHNTGVEIIGGIWIAITICWGIFYGFAKDGFGNGQSYGKKMNGLMVVNLTDNRPCTKGRSCLRILPYFIPYIGGIIEIIMVFANERGRRLGDMLASTQVIEVDQYRR
jgi:uncharacterized RDD family membrane protein YckC